VKKASISVDKNHAMFTSESVIQKRRKKMNYKPECVVCHGSFDIFELNTYYRLKKLTEADWLKNPSFLKRNSLKKTNVLGLRFLDKKSRLFFLSEVREKKLSKKLF